MTSRGRRVPLGGLILGKKKFLAKFYYENLLGWEVKPILTNEDMAYTSSFKVTYVYVDNHQKENSASIKRREVLE